MFFGSGQIRNVSHLTNLPAYELEDIVKVQNIEVKDPDSQSSESEIECQ